MDPRADRPACRCTGRPACAPRRTWQPRAGCTSRRTCDRAWADALLDRWRFRPVSGTPWAQSANLLRGADGIKIVAITGGNHRGRMRSALPQSPDVTGARWGLRVRAKALNCYAIAQRPQRPSDKHYGRACTGVIELKELYG